METVEYTLPTLVHIAGGLVGILSGTAAATFKKGSTAHKRSGYVFIAAMVIMAIPAGLISYLEGRPFDVLSSVLTLYMIFTGLMTFRPDTERSSIVLMCIAALCIAGYLAAELATQMFGVRATDAPIGAGYVFATVMGLALWGDLKRRIRPLSTQKLVVRHLWRMGIGFFMATGNLFGVRPHLFPEWMQSSGILVVLAIAPLVLMAYWAIRIRIRPLGAP